MRETPEKARQETPFWRFSLRLYARPGVAPACLALQDEAGVDVNVMLFLLFLADRGIAVSSDDVQRFDGAVREWREEVVKPLRALRRRLKSGIEPVARGDSDIFRNAVKRAELEAEHMQQDVLWKLVPAPPARALPRAEAARTNLAAYAATLRPFPREAAAEILAAFDALTA